MTGTLKITVGSEDEGPKAFVEAWHAAEAGEALPCVDSLVFEDLETLLRALTPARWKLLKVLREIGPTSVRALARTLGRDYKNVHTDVRQLELLGSLTRADGRKIAVPWEAVLAELRLAA